MLLHRSFWQYLLPQHLLSRLAGKVCSSEAPWLKRLLINSFIRHYPVNMDEAEQSDPNSYASFNAFFTRSLNAQARIMPEDHNCVISPVDGCISQVGCATDGRLIQAKGHDFSVDDLLADGSLGRTFRNAPFTTLYLAPADYHRVHMPIAGKLKQMIYVPGKLFSVNKTTAKNINNLFARNERVVFVFDTEIGEMALVMVGAIMVGSVVTEKEGQIAPGPFTRTVEQWTYSDPIEYSQGQELAHFQMGSTVILLFSKGSVDWQKNLQEDSVVRLYQPLADFTEEIITQDDVLGS